MKFKVGDRVRYKGTNKNQFGRVGEIIDIWENKYDNEVIVVVDIGEEYPYHFLERVIEIYYEKENEKTPHQLTLEELEKRIEKLEKMLSMGKYANESKENVSNFEKMTQKPSLLTEDERVILRNLEDDYEWIVRDETGWLTIHTNYPYINKHHNWISDGDSNFFDLFNHIFQFIKWGDKPYNIEELLKGEE